MNAQTKHTPGPWEADGRVVLQDGETYVERGMTFARSDMAAVCERVRSDADARLIAAAPELLDALKDILRIATAASIGVSGNAPRLERARAAIAKAVTP